MRVRIIRRPLERELDGCDAQYFQPGRVYDVSSRLAQVLMVTGCAMAEMRQSDRDPGPWGRPSKGKRAPR